MRTRLDGVIIFLTILSAFRLFAVLRVRRSMFRETSSSKRRASRRARANTLTSVK